MEQTTIKSSMFWCLKVLGTFQYLASDFQSSAGWRTLKRQLTTRNFYLDITLYLSFPSLFRKHNKTEGWILDSFYSSAINSTNSLINPFSALPATSKISVSTILFKELNGLRDLLNYIFHYQQFYRSKIIKRYSVNKRIFNFRSTEFVIITFSELRKIFATNQWIQF